MFNHWIRSLSARLWVTSIVALAISLTVLATAATYAFSHFPQQMLGLHEEMESATAIASGLRFDGTGRLVSVALPSEKAWLFEVAPTELKYRVLDERGNVLLASNGAEGREAWIAGDLAGAVGNVQRVEIGAKPFEILTLRVPHGSAVFYTQTATSERFVNAIIDAKIKPMPAIIKTIVLVATIIFGLSLPFTVHRVLKPLREASRAAARITPRNLTTRLSTTGIPSEIKPLIHAFNETLDRLEKGFAVQQQFLASAAHELQTPLTLIRGQIELQPGIDDKDLLFREIDLMARQVRQLLHLAEVSESQNFSFGEVNIVDVVQDVVAYLARKADRREVTLRLETTVAPSSIWADRSALFILLKNIVENAINASPAHGTVVLIVDAVSVQVQDEGPGIRQEYLPFLFKRFWRAPDARHEGAGLGLAICKEIATAHEWRLTVSSLVSGTRFAVWFS
ncbi:HAMP domain-containing histidine kinase [Paraburkholderia sp. WS6]|uniref:histidine kinase n=1 Tax=Paraburkholderia madseniana TaxID=2599607 RepID=A0AAP5EUK7_9BURK|nr:ATP-binding protein [Paraburkholderia sp. WS6]MCX4144825.1 ATP-binding protein [Paraburkholderia madseniana]MDN7147777.1 HAMP domain-containing histidine kinase [Paraburkholderia sp. WS6]MDQ6406657.1 HAMP domain-containing histidine kinase [Paraburkholderia madseniana]